MESQGGVRPAHTGPHSHVWHSESQPLAVGI